MTSSFKEHFAVAVTVLVNRGKTYEKRITRAHLGRQTCYGGSLL
jgi:hypothetical protein